MNIITEDYHVDLPYNDQVRSGIEVAQVQSTVRDFLRVHESSLDTNITGRVLANIFHGISTPQFPATTWSRCHRFWKAHMNIDWPSIKRIATQELLIHYTCT
ncbi:unnamed protein product [Trichobilharzia regenti]|nr:unnamed protein product [Trichobilharzia regenti]